MSEKPATLRQSLVDAMSGHQAHITFDSAIKDFPANLRGKKPAGAPHTAWQLLEHLRIAQWDILEFSKASTGRDAAPPDERGTSADLGADRESVVLHSTKRQAHKSPKWPDDYWPKEEAPPDDKAWDNAIAQFRKDSKEMAKLIKDESQDLLAPFPHGEGQTLLREALLIANHNSYHLGELVFLKKQLTSVTGS